MKKTNLLIIAHNNLGNSLSGGDQIFLNLIKYTPSTITITIVGSAETKHLLDKFQVTPTNFLLSAPENNIQLNTINLFFHQIIRIFYSLIFFFSHLNLFHQTQFIYTSSDFPSDSIYGILTKIFFPKNSWIAGFYLFAPFPFSRRSPYNTTNHFFRGVAYYIGQLPIYIFTKYLANIVAVTSTPDTLRFPQNTIIIQGGVDIHKIKKHSHSSINKRQYDAVFLGRLHPQKGVLQLVDIWNLVIKKIPQARLAIIGDGELKPELEKKISKLDLNHNIKLFGFKYGHSKNRIFQNSKIVVHPATYDSGGMAAAEAMSWGLPGVSFDLEALKTYYPQGMLKTPCFDNQQFAQNIIKLLTKQSTYQKTSQEALELIKKSWSWSMRLRPIYNAILS